MAPTLQYINKFSGHLFTLKHLSVVRQKYFVRQCKQYSRSLHPQYQVLGNSWNHVNIENSLNSVTDNRELRNDIVTKVHVDRLEISERLCSAEVSKPKQNVVLSSKSSEDSGGRPSPEKLLHIYKVLGESLPNLFVQTLDYTVYHENIVFEDNIRNIKTIGLLNYGKQVALIRTIGHLRFAYVKFDILKITQHPEDGTVRIRWRIKGISGLKVMLFFWKYRLWNWKEMFEKCENWYDGYSTFFVNADGKIVKHVADKMMPDSDSITTETPSTLSSAKLALMVAVIPRFTDVGLPI